MRHRLVLGMMLGLLALLGARAVFLQAIDSSYLQEQGNARHLRVVEDNSHRGMILDRNGEPLAISTPIDSLWANPDELSAQHAQWPVLAKLLDISVRDIGQQVQRHAGREFMYLKRHVAPETAQRVMALRDNWLCEDRRWERYWASRPAYLKMSA